MRRKFFATAATLAIGLLVQAGLSTAADQSKPIQTTYFGTSVATEVDTNFEKMATQPAAPAQPTSFACANRAESLRMA